MVKKVRRWSPPVASTLTAGTSSPKVSAPGRRKEDDENLVVEPQAICEGAHGVTLGDVTTALQGHGGKPGQGYQAALFPLQDVSGRDKSQNGRGWSEEEISYTLDTTGAQGVAVAPIDLRQSARGEKNTNDRVTGGGAPGTGVGNPGDPAYTVSERGQGVAGYGSTGYGRWEEGASTLTAHEAKEPHQVAVSAPGFYSTAGSHNVGEPEELSPTVKVGAGKEGSAGVPLTACVPIDTSQAQRRSGATGVGTPGTGIGEDGDPSPALGSSRATPAVATYRKAQRAHHAEDCERWQEDELADTLDAGGHTARTATAVHPAYPMSLRGREGGTQAEMGKAEEPMHALRTPGGSFSYPYALAATQMAECGCCPIDPKPDSPRYKACGNAVTVPVIAFIADLLISGIDWE